ncbi:MAG: hypothetical protein C4338_05820 [Rhodanobacteraceae bacterium]
MLKRLILPAALLVLAGSAFAQQPAQNTAPAAASSKAAPQLTPEQKAALIKQNQQMATNAQAVAQLIDQGKISDVWDQASPVAKQAVTKDAFVSGVTAQRKQVGSLVSRKLAGVTRTVSKGDQKLPAGYYINVIFASQFSNAKQPVRELVSYHYDSDKVWRLSGYTLR